ncbi:ATP-binding protein [Micromonospora sp. WMMD882]|uniref:NACHT domain-containing protein n=1 Tax=Micromonospora sp. WMMD882 TaxID=3015151 RepID=UPI00248C27EF|nr:ATP-binding protein [Micromonospora sp. WMMD882]WBB79903.1 ATP-binding protein [Micromonospora sp. WMMD882]
MGDRLSYADAVRLLGGERSRFVEAFDRLAGWALLAGSGPAPALLGLFDAKAELVRLGRDLLRQLSEQRSGLSRYGRTQRLEAAHAVLVVTAFFEALRSADLPFALADLEIDRSEQLALAGGGAAPLAVPPLRGAVAQMFTLPARVPGAHLPYERLRDTLAGHYRELGARLAEHVTGLAAWDRLPAHHQRAFHESVARLPADAVARHRDLLTALAVDFPEVAYWSGVHEHTATRDEVRQLAAGLGDLRRTLDAISTGRLPDEQRTALARAHLAKLDRPIVESAEAPDGLRVPLLGEAYLPPRCRVAVLDQSARPGDEEWWAGQDVRDDLAGLLAGHLTGSVATRAPLLVLGQPGSGKSVLTRVLAAQLPAADFLVVRVPLREVSAEADLQDQIEQAIRYDTGERLDWPALVRSAGDALPVVLLDGFDELLQATGVTQTDYLLRVARFQRREARQGRPVAVLVTTRTSVADRATPPPETVALRLEPFDETRVRRWVATWNRANSDRFAPLGVPPLDPEAVLAHPELAGQPLLLLMLALYAAAGHDLPAAGELRRSELYERLLGSFARREVTKHRPGLTGRELGRATEDELRRLAVVAFGMFNRGVQWITEDDLEADLSGLPFLAGGPASGRGGVDLRAPLRPAEVVLGRFFFVHRSQATRDDARVATYEFLHATFGEYLVARTTALVLGDLTAVAAASSLLPSVDDDPLAALLSGATLTERAPIVTFLTELVRSWDDDRRADATELLLRLFRAAHDPRPPRRFETYRPRALSVPARHAAYSANLLVLLLCAADEIHGRDLYPDATDPRTPWRSQALLWRSQLAGEHEGLTAALALDRSADGDRRDIRLRLADPDWQPQPPDPGWTYGFSGEAVRVGLEIPELRRTANFECWEWGPDFLLHALEPSAGEDGLPLAMLVNRGPGWQSALHLLLRMWLGRSTATSGADRYLPVAQVATSSPFMAHRQLNQVMTLLLGVLTVDPVIRPDAVVPVLRELTWLDPWDVTSGSAFFRCCLTFLGRDPDTDRDLADLVDVAADRLPADTNPRLELLLAEAHVRLTERGLARYRYAAAEVARLTPWLAASRPDLIDRLRRLVAPDEELSGRPWRRGPDPVGGDRRAR